jgi:phosphoglycolate phosphatase-like HAD superfamily hydrolase
MNLAIFDVDGTLTESNAVDEVCFVQAVQDVFGISRINTNWLDYSFQTDSGLALEICRNRLGFDPSDAEISSLQSRFVKLLGDAIKGTGHPIREVRGAAALLQWLRAHPRWRVAIATGGWNVPARLKLESAGLAVEALPWASADDAMDRMDIIRIANERAREAYCQDSFEKIVYVGDGVWDIRAAKALRIGFLGVAVGNAAMRLVQEGVSCALPDFSDLVRVGDCLEEVARKPYEKKV